jgi:hypothetical protein
MSKACSCNVSLQNTGTPNCPSVFGVTKQLILVPMFADDGTENKIDPTTTLDSAYFTALINQADDSKRWYPTGILTNVAGERGDPIYETFENGQKDFIRQTPRTFTAMLLKGSAALLNQFNANRCSTFGAFIIDNEGAIIGKSKYADGNVYPIEIQASSFYNKLAFTTDTTGQKIMMSFEYAIEERDEDLLIIDSSNIVGVNLVKITGLMNVTVKVVSTTTTVMTIKLYNENGKVGGSPITGLVTADFISSVGGATSKIRRTNNTPADVTVTVAETSTPGTYTLTYTTQTAADTLQPLIKKNGLDASGMIGTVGTVA